MIVQLSSSNFTPKDLDVLQGIVDLYVSLNQNTGFIEILNKALNMVKRKASIIEDILKEAKQSS